MSSVSIIFPHQLFEKNPRLNMLVHTFDKMNSEKQNSYLKTAEKFLENI